MLIRRLLTPAAAALVVIVLGGPAQAADVEHDGQQDEVITSTSPLTCEEGSPIYEITSISDVRSTRISTDGHDLYTFRRVGTFTAEPLDPALPTYTGHFVQRGTTQRTEHDTTVAETGSFSTTLQGNGSDGSRIRQVSQGHLTFVIRPDGTVQEVFFDRCVA